MFKIYQLSFVLLLIVHPIQAKNLLELYQLAEDSDPQLKIANQERLITFEKKAQAQAPLLPEISLGANANENWNTQHWMSGHNVENTHIGYNISLRYTLYRREFNIQLEQVDSQINQVNALYEVAKQELIERLSTRYFAILSAQDTLKFERIAKRAFKRQLEEAQQRFQVGLIAITDVEEAQAGYDLAIADEIQAKNDLDNAHEGLRELTGTYHQILATLKTEVPLLEPDPANIDAWTQTALEHNPKLLAAQYAIENARLDIGKQRAAHLPTIDLVAQHSYNHNLRGDDTGALTNNNSIGIQLNYYLYEGGAIRARTRESQQYRIKAIEEQEQQRRLIQSKTRQAFWNLKSSISRVKALKQAVTSTETALNAIQTGFELGTRTSVDVINAQRDLLRAQRNYSRARYDYVLNTLRLKLAVGLLSPDDLVGINDWLESP